MSTTSRRGTLPSITEEMGPWLTAIIAVCLGLSAFPAWLLDLLAQHLLERFLFSWRLRFLIWFVLTGLAGYALYSLSLHGLQALFSHELADYILAGKHYQADFLRWPWGMLWADTWPVWLCTLVGIPIAAFFQELAANAHPGQTVRQIRLRQRRRERAIARATRRASKRTSRPTRVPDEIGGIMTMGAPIDEHDEEERTSWGI